MTPDPTNHLYWYRAQLADDGDVSKYTRPVVDGDSVYLWVSLGFHSWIMKLCRLHGIDTPERGEDGFEEAADALRETLLIAEDIVVHSEDLGKYGRPLVTIHTLHDGEWPNVNDFMIDEGYAEVY